MNKIIIRFIVALNRINNEGKTSISCRITYLKIRNQFSTGLFINPKHWNRKHQKAEPPNDENEFINSQLSLIKSKINKAFLLLQIQESSFTVIDIYTLYKGKKSVKEYNRLNTLKST